MEDDPKKVFRRSDQAIVVSESSAGSIQQVGQGSATLKKKNKYASV